MDTASSIAFTDLALITSLSQTRERKLPKTLWSKVLKYLIPPHANLQTIGSHNIIYKTGICRNSLRTCRAVCGDWLSLCKDDVPWAQSVELKGSTWCPDFLTELFAASGSVLISDVRALWFGLRDVIGDGQFNGYGNEYDHDYDSIQLSWCEGAKPHSVPNRSRYYRGGRFGEEKLTSGLALRLAPKSLKYHFCFCVCKLLGGGHDFTCASSCVSYDCFSGNDGSSNSYTCSVIIRLGVDSLIDEETFTVSHNCSTDV